MLAAILKQLSEPGVTLNSMYVEHGVRPTTAQLQGMPFSHFS